MKTIMTQASAYATPKFTYQPSLPSSTPYHLEAQWFRDKENRLYCQWVKRYDYPT